MNEVYKYLKKVASTKSRDVARYFAEKMGENVARRKGCGWKSRDDLKSRSLRIPKYLEEYMFYDVLRIS